MIAKSVQMRPGAHASTCPPCYATAPCAPWWNEVPWFGQIV